MCLKSPATVSNSSERLQDPPGMALGGGRIFVAGVRQRPEIGVGGRIAGTVPGTRFQTHITKATN